MRRREYFAEPSAGVSPALKSRRIAFAGKQKEVATIILSTMLWCGEHCYSYFILILILILLSLSPSAGFLIAVKQQMQKPAQPRIAASVIRARW